MREPKAGDVYFNEETGCVMVIYENATEKTLTTMWLNGAILTDIQIQRPKTMSLGYLRNLML